MMTVVNGPPGAVTVVVVVTGAKVASLEKHEQALLSCAGSGALRVAQGRSPSSARRARSRRSGRTVRVCEAVSVVVALLRGRKGVSSRLGGGAEGCGECARTLGWRLW